MLSRLMAVGQRGVRVRALGGSRAGEMQITRLLRNDRVSVAEMVSLASARTAGLVSGRHVLAIQDTTTLQDDGVSTSLVLHPTIAVDASSGALLGLVEAELLRRSGGAKGKRRQRAVAEKQSQRWLNGTVAAGRLMAHGASSVTVIADSEGDLYEEFAVPPAGVDLLIRSGQDRCLADGSMLFACLAQEPELGRVTIDLAAAPGRPARVARLALRARPVTLARPRRPAAIAATLPAAITLTLVEAREIAPPAGAEPAHWRLLTTHAVADRADAERITGFYRQRWTIEQLFRVMKTKGFDVEAVRIAEPAPYEKLATAILIAAVKVLQLVQERDGRALRPLADVFDPADIPALEAICATLEGKTARQKNPHPRGSLAYAAWVCARLGGWTGYYGKPGPVVMLNGFHQFKAINHGWNLHLDV